jgi:hypothetical protein
VFTTVKDWDAIVQDFREGMSLEALSAKHDISLVGLRKGLKKRGLQRNLDGAIREVAKQQANDDLLQMVGTPVNIDRIRALGEAHGKVLTKHRGSIAAGQLIVRSLLQELDTATRSLPMVEEKIIEYFTAHCALEPLKVGIFRQQMANALASLSLGNRSKTMLNLVSAMEKLVNMERKAYNLDEDEGEKTYEDHLREMHEKIIKPQRAALAPPTPEPVVP